jgi:mRNA interferase MazF
MRRGNLVVVSLPGDYGKPRPALILQSDAFSSLVSRTLLPLTTTEADSPLLRIPIDPSPGNGLERRSYIMVDKLYTMPASKIGKVCGSVDESTLIAVTRSLAAFLGFA